MSTHNRREFLQGAAAIGTGIQLHGLPSMLAFPPSGTGVNTLPDWVRSARLLIAEGYSPPFYPALDYDPGKAVDLALRLGCNALRFPSFSYVAYYPTQTKLPRHKELGNRDLLKETQELCHQAGLKLVVYNPQNHPFMDVTCDDPNYKDWTRRFANGDPMITDHFGWGTYYEGCLNSPLRDQTKEQLREVISNYSVDMMYFDGAYQGMAHEPDFCHCKYCKEAYWKARGKDIPLQDANTRVQDLIDYRQWMEQEVVVAFMQEICTMVREVRDVPQTYNNGEMLRNGWTAKAYLIPELSTFMFEAAQTPEQKLFNIRAGQSTGRNLWTYIGSHTVYNREHLAQRYPGGWFTDAMGGEQLQLDAAVATVAGAGYCFWALNRLFYEPDEINRPSVSGLKKIFDFARENEELLRSTQPKPQVGILVCTQAIGWYQDDMFVPSAYGNYYYGAFQVMKDLGYDVEPFLDYRLTQTSLEKYKLVLVPNAPCLSDAQCKVLERYVEDGGTLLATHLTSIADEYGRRRGNFGLARLLGAKLNAKNPVTQRTDLYIRKSASGEMILQDPQVMSFDAAGAAVLAETYSRGQRSVLGPAVIRNSYGKGQALYIGSGLEAVYDETLNRSILDYFRTLLDPVLSAHRGYEVEFRRGLMPELTTSENSILLHLLANTGNIWKKALAEEAFLPLEDVHVRVRVPAGRRVGAVSLMQSKAEVSWKVRGGWVELTVPRIHIYEVARVDLI